MNMILTKEFCIHFFLCNKNYICNEESVYCSDFNFPTQMASLSQTGMSGNYRKNIIKGSFYEQFHYLNDIFIYNNKEYNILLLI
jgi:hypothetical protein